MGTISTILTTAVNWQLILSNPCDRVKATKVAPTSPKLKNLSDNESVVFINEALSNAPLQQKILFTLTLVTGYRVSEIVPLQWSDIDYDKLTLSINKTVSYIPRSGQIVRENTAKRVASDTIENILKMVK